MRNCTQLLGKLSFLSLLTVLLTFSKLNAQSFTIGSGSATTPANAFPNPLQDYFEGSRAQYLFRASELTAAGMSAGTITSISFDVTSLYSFNGTIDAYTIKMGSTSLNSLSTTGWVGGTTEVYGPINYVPVVGTNTFNFSSPFFWNGIDNIVVEVCNGSDTDPNFNTFTDNVIVRQVTGLSFNASRTYLYDNLGSLCDATSTANDGTPTSRPIATFTMSPAPACTGTPDGGVSVASETSVCNRSTPFTVGVTGATIATGLSYQWEQSDDNITWTPIVGATSATLIVNSISSSQYYRRKISCSGAFAYSTSDFVSYVDATYASLPYTESFETTWLSLCDTRETPNIYWQVSPVTGSNSWRRNDDSVAANWSIPTSGRYTPTSSSGNYSARFHSYGASPEGITGTMDLFVNAATGTPGKKLFFDYINKDGRDSLVVFFSTDGGNTFSRLGSVQTATDWTTKSFIFSSVSATTIIRFVAYSDAGDTDFGLDNVIVEDFASCSGTPAGGISASSALSICPNVPVTLTVTGDADAFGLTYQWERSIDGGATWTNVTGGNTEVVTVTDIIQTTTFRRKIICGSLSSYSTSITVTALTPNYVVLPYSESFETPWLSICAANDVPNNSWRGLPVTGNNSWRRNDDGSSANWTSITTGAYSPVATSGTFSARFHSAASSMGTKGILNLYINANTGIASKRLMFDVINTAGSDSLVVSISTNGGATFTRLDSARSGAGWRTKTVLFSATSSTTVIRFEAVSDNGASDIGLDNLSVVDFPLCTGTPTGGTAASSANNICPSTPFTLSVTGSTEANGLTYQWQQSSDGVTFTNISGATGITYNSTGITTATYYRRQVTCSGNTSLSAPVQVKLVAPVYAGMPFTESFENTWISVCATREIPNNSWRNAVLTGNTSWRRNDDGAAASWTNLTGGTYSPTAAAGTYSARFHTAGSPNGQKGSMHLYLDANTASPVKKLSFSVINASGNDSLVISVSTNGGATFVRIDSSRSGAGGWRTKTVNFNSTSATTVIRFEAISDAGSSDIGLDNISVVDFENCAGTPTGGTAISSLSTVCTEPYTVSLSGATSGNGITYQWQSSTDGGATWNNIPGATGFNYTTTQSVTTQYRAVVSCSFSSASATSSVVIVNSPDAVNGIYTIDSRFPTDIAARRFASFNDAYNQMRCGINGPTTFNVVPGTGPYNEQLIMRAIPGASAINTITFNGNGNTISYSSTNNLERATIKLRGASYITFDSLVIDAIGNYGYGIHFMAGSVSNTVKRCVINTNTTATTENFAGIVLNGTDASLSTSAYVQAHDNNFYYNKINGGFAGFSINNSYLGASGRNKFIGNDVREFSRYGFYLKNTFEFLLDSNTISRPTRSAGLNNFQGIYCDSLSSAIYIVNNTITNPFGGAPSSTLEFTGIAFANNKPESFALNVLYNNLIYNINGLGAQTGISNINSDYAVYVHNTIALDNTTASAATTRGFYQSTQASAVQLNNNMITIRRAGTGAKHALYFATQTTVFESDFNNLFVSPASANSGVGYYIANRPTLSAWTIATKQDNNSYSRDPIYNDVSVGDLRPTNGALDNKGTDLPVDEDIIAVPRSSTPDLGAFEFTAPVCSLPVLTGNTIFSDSTVCENVAVNLNLTLDAWGSSQTFTWEASPSGAAGTFVPVSVALSDPDTTILSTTSLYYRVAVRCGATTEYSNAVLLNVSPALPSGTYTINKALPTSYPAGTNFNSFNDAKAAMMCGIIGGPIVFDVVAGSGPYNEQLKLDSIYGASAVNTITFMGNGNRIYFNPTTSNERAVIKLNGADHIRFDSLVIDASGATANGYGVQLINNADSNVFRNNTILASMTLTANTLAGVVINSTDIGPNVAGNTWCDSNLFVNNIISGGYYGVTLVGGPITIRKNTFLNNSIRDFFSHGFYVAATTDALIEGNSFSRPTRTTGATAIYAIQAATTASSNLQVNRNRFTNMFGGAPAQTTSTFYAVHTSVSAPVANETKVTNNVIHTIGGNAAIFGFYNVASNNVFYLHNTIAFDNTASTSAAATVAFYNTAKSTGLFKNNIVSISRGGNGLKHAIYFNDGTTDMESDRNVFNIAAANAHVGYFPSSSRTSLADWQAASGEDKTSVATNPLFTDPASGNYKPMLGFIDNTGLDLNVDYDFNNIGRSNTPDIGAYEFAPVPCGTPVPGIASVTPSSGACMEIPITLNVTGHSALGSLTFQWQSSRNGVTGWVNISGVQYFPEFNTITGTNTYYRAIVKCGSLVDSTTVAHITLNTTLEGGTYTINSALPTDYFGPATGTNFQSFTDAVNVMTCGITGPVVFNVVAGTYNEKIRIGYVPNSSLVNNVIFQSANGIASSVNLTFNTTTGANYTLKLDSTKYFTFRNMTISATDLTNGRVVELSGNASEIVLEKNIITTPAVISASTNNAAVYASGLKGKNNVIRKNTISGGSYGIHLAGTGVGANLTQDHIVDSNSVSGAYAYGIFTQFAKRVQINANTIDMAGPVAANAYGIATTDADSTFRVIGNKITIRNTTTNVFGVNINSSDSGILGYSHLYNNIVTATNNNSGTLYGLYLNNSVGVHAMNNVVSLNTTGAGAYGIYFNNGSGVKFHNNSVYNTSTSATNNYAVYLNNSPASNITLRNNIMVSNTGRALYAANVAAATVSDYNMMYTTGAVLAQVGSPAATYASIATWRAASFWDENSIVHAPAFADADILTPALSNPDVWAMHGRGVQVPESNFDINYNARPITRITGVPDLGAYEFFPVALPTLLNGNPVTPVANSMQTFTYGSDTVMKIKWGPAVPPSIQLRRYSGVVPSGLPATSDSMFFYVKAEIPGGGDYNGYDADLFYVDSWLGSIPSAYQLGLGKTTASNSWVVGFTSYADVKKKKISQTGLNYVDKFTGLVNPYARPNLDKDTSSRGKNFWVAYQKSWHFTNGSNSQDMVLYLSTGSEPANVVVRVNGTSWERNYVIPPFTTKASDYLPKSGSDDARLMNEGLYGTGINITSDVPITAYAHIFASTNSGATMLFPTGTWGYEYYTLNNRQNYSTTGSYTTIFVVSNQDSTLVEITPSTPTLGGRPANVPFQVYLDKGEVYQVLGAMISGSEGYDLSGSSVRSISNASGKCYPIGVFSGSSRTGLGCGTSAGGSGDLLLNQVFPYQAWGKRYLTAPTVTGGASNKMRNIVRVLVKDPTTKVYRNNVQLTGLIVNRYYQYETNTADEITSDKPIMVSLYMPSSGQCGNPSGNGDPDNFFISPIEQGVNYAGFYRNTEDGIEENYVSVIIPNEGMATLKIDGVPFASIPAAEKASYTHTGNPRYTVVVKSWPAGAGQSKIESDSAFTGLVFGLGGAESYGYNVGTMVKNLQALGTITNSLNTSGGVNEYTCEGSPFKFKGLLPLKPTKLTWKFSGVPGIEPNADVVQVNPVPTDSSMINGVKYYLYPLDTEYKFPAAGIYGVQIIYEHPDIEGCDKSGRDIIYVQVVPAPKSDFTLSGAFTGCAGQTASLTGPSVTPSGIVINQWLWTLSNGTSPTTQTTSITYTTPGTFTEKLRVITPDGCLGDSSKTVVVNPLPTVTMTSPDSVSVCGGSNHTWTVQSPVSTNVYNWYSSPTGGTPIATGSSYTIASVSGRVDIYIEAVSSTGCTTPGRKKLTVTTQPPLPTPAVSVIARSVSTVTFTWPAVAGAVTYEVSVNGGAFQPVTGPGNNHTVSGMSPLQTVNVVIRANGTVACINSFSASTQGCSDGLAMVTQDTVKVCAGTAATFNVQSPVAGSTYTWYATATGGSPITTGTSYTVPSVSATTNYYVEQTSSAGCVTSARTRVTAALLPNVTAPVVTVDSVGSTSVKFKWTAIAGATGYEVSTNGGTTWSSPSSGTTGLFHVVTGLQPLEAVTLTVRVLGGCTQPVSEPVTERAKPDQVFIPNSFSPNADGLNDKLMIYGYTIKEMQWSIFNQWGEKIFESRDQNTGWDGTYKGKLQPSGVYMYVVKLTLKDGSKVDMKGSINLIR